MLPLSEKGSAENVLSMFTLVDPLKKKDKKLGKERARGSTVMMNIIKTNFTCKKKARVYPD